VITTATEHHATLHAVAALDRLGFASTVLPVDRFGRISPEALAAAIRPDTVLVSAIYANNEIGTINPVAALAAVCRARGVVFHVDAVQAVGALPMNVDELGADLVSISGHKFYGPKGIGMLYARHGVALDPLIHGGAQERGRRAGTENVPGIVGLAAAMQLAHDELEANVLHSQRLRDRLIEGVLGSIRDSSLNGHPSDRLPNNAHFTFRHTEGTKTTESLVGALDHNGICASTGSACNTRAIEPSHVLMAIGLSAGDAHGSLRFTLGRSNTDEQITRVLELLPEIIRRRRTVSRAELGARSRAP
jgi:cysteine desulfurase